MLLFVPMSRMSMVISFALSSLLGLGCALDSVDEGGSDSDFKRIPADDPDIDSRLDALDIVCESTLKVTGTLAPGAAAPEDHLGCWPVGTWTLTAEIDRLGCDPQPEIPAAMNYTVSFNELNNTIDVLWADDPNDERVNLKISTEGDGLCHGSMEHFGTDFTVWGFKPTLNEDGTLTGIGTYSVFAEDPF